MEDNRKPGRIVFVGAVHEARPALAALLGSPLAEVAAVITATDAGRARLAGAVDFDGLIPDSVPVLRTDNANAPEMVDTVRRLRPDLLVVVGWTRLIGRALLAVPRHGTVGFHASLLPRNRGRAPVNWAILRGEKVTGNTMMMLDPGVDTGDIVDQRPVPIGQDDTCGSVYLRLAALGADMLLAHLPALLAGTAPRRRQPPALGDPLPKRTPEMGVLDWDRPAAAVHDWIRALTFPYPGAFTSVGGRRAMVLASQLPAVGTRRGEPGTILGFQDSAMLVATRDGGVLVTRMAVPGEESRSARGWCERTGTAVGTRFDAVPTAISRWALGLGPHPARLPA
ncbi:methionyl-tRNA formyltransferase [Fodinicola acaciae]|uniref:methionyl-tRNA formyltransferase n=1 Tax=Fodinicola acaciae TaxID=2681555 RepID=UPI0013D24FD1|nr:methionyl-tRNA formyltransferase [Fodinicola acaciae]